MGEITDALRHRGDTVPDLRPPRRPSEPASTYRLPEIAPAAQQEIPRNEEGAWRGRIVLARPASLAAEQYRRIALRVSRALDERKANSVLVTSAVRAEGKTTTACNIALAAAELFPEKRVALVELDLRIPSFASVLRLRIDPGIETALRGGCNLSDAVIRTDASGLEVLAAGAPTSEVRDLLAGAPLRQLWLALRERYDLIVVDGPPSLGLSDTPITLDLVDCCLIVARAGTSRLRMLDDMIAEISADKILGVLMNGAHAARRATASYRHYEYYREQPPDGDEPREP